MLLEVQCRCVLEYLIPYMGQLELSQIPVKGGVIDPDVHGLLDVPGHAL